MALRRRRPRRRRSFAWLLVLLAMGAGGVWLWTGIFPENPRFQAMLILRNGDSIRLLNGETLHLRPEDHIRISNITTNILLNRGVRIFSIGLDANALLYEEMPLHRLLPENRTFEHHQFRVEIKRGGSMLGHVTLVVEPSAKDWLARAARIIDPQKRLEHLERALEHHPEDEEILDRIIAENMDLENWKKASAMLEIKARKRPEDEKVLQRLLSVYEAAGDRDGTLSTLRRMADFHSDDPVLAFRIAGKLEDEGRTSEAMEEYERVLGLLEQEEDRAAVLKTLGYMYSQSGDIQRAIERYAEAADIQKDDANLYYNLAGLHDKVGNTEKADEYLKMAVSLEISDVDARMRLAERALKRGGLDEAEEYLKEVLTVEPDYLEAMLLLADVYDQRGERNKLKELYGEMLPLAPENEILIYNLAVLEYEAGDYADSALHLSRYLDLRPDDINARELLLDSFIKLEKWDAASQTGLTLLEHEPENPDYYHIIFDILADQERWNELLPVLKRGVASLPGNPVITDYLILAYLKLGRTTHAMDLMKEALDRRPGDLGLMHRLAQLADRQGEEDLAADTYRKILEIEPEHEEVKEALVRLLVQRARRQEAARDIDSAMATYMEAIDLAPGNEEAAESFLRLRLQKVRGEGED